MKRLFILGAGASRELSFNIRIIDRGATKTVRDVPHKEIGPLSSGYFYYTNKLYNSLKKDLQIVFEVKVSDILMEYIKKYYKCNFNGNIDKEDLLQKEEVSKKVNIEKLYIFLKKKILEDEKNAKNLPINRWDVDLYMAEINLLEYIHTSLSCLSYYCTSNNYKILSEYIIKNEGNIISFNWDILFEEAMMSTCKWSPKDGYGFNFKEIIYKNEEDRRKKMINEINSNNFILKPHGSINWYNKNGKINEQILLIQLNPNLRSGNFGLLERLENNCYSSIVPPGAKEKISSELWNKMKCLLEQTDEIVTIGFSFNDNDLHIKNELNRINYKKNLKITIINPENEKLGNIYAEVFCTNNLEMKFKTFSEYCQMLIEKKEI
jgi:hypothetical protein